MYVKIMLTNVMLSIMVIVASTGTSPALYAVANYFSDIDPVSIKSLITLPFLLMVPSSLLSEKLSIFLGRRNALLLCTTIFLIAGIAPAFCDNFYIIMVFRAFVGIAVGFIIPMASALIPENIPLHLRAQMMGLSAAMCNLASVAIAFIAGLLALYTWRANFVFYAFAFLPLICVLAYIPKTTIINKAKVIQDKLPLVVNLMCLALGLSCVASYCVFTDISFLVEDKFPDSSNLTGRLLSTYTAFAFLGCMILAFVKKIVGNTIVILSTLCQALALIIIYLSPSPLILYFGMALQGIFGGMIIPAVFIINSEIANQNQQVKALGLANCSMFLFSFLSPMVLASLKSLMNLSSISSIYLTAATFMSGVCLLFIFIYVKYLYLKKNS